MSNTSSPRSLTRQTWRRSAMALRRRLRRTKIGTRRGDLILMWSSLPRGHLLGASANRLAGHPSNTWPFFELQNATTGCDDSLSWAHWARPLIR